MSYSESTLTADVHDRRFSSPNRQSGQLRPLAALAVVALLGACGSNAPSASGTGDNTNANLEKAVQFSRCMRANGVSNFPDPDPSGQLTIDQVANSSSVDTSSAAFQQALSTCRSLEPAGFAGQPRSAQQQEAALKFAQCIRDNGVKDFPDPAPDAPLIDTDLIPSAATSSGMDALHAAMHKCGSMAAAAGVTGGR